MLDRVLFVCVGNICRSPTAEALWNARRVSKGLAATGWSAGIGAEPGREIYTDAAELLVQSGIDASTHRSQPLRTSMLRDSSLVLVMEHWHKAELEKRAPFARGRIYCLGHWSDNEIPDPYGRSVETFRRVYQLIDQGVDEWLARW
ncbi:low molecular weight protein-tyrosine-phosphatase [Methylolobus aquaticus]